MKRGLVGCWHRPCGLWTKVEPWARKSLKTGKPAQPSEAAFSRQPGFQGCFVGGAGVSRTWCLSWCLLTIPSPTRLSQRFCSWLIIMARHHLYVRKSSMTEHDTTTAISAVMPSELFFIPSGGKSAAVSSHSSITTSSGSGCGSGSGSGSGYGSVTAAHMKPAPGTSTHTLPFWTHTAGPTEQFPAHRDARFNPMFISQYH